MRPGHIWHLGIKEFRSLLRDPVMLVLIVFSFTFAVYSAATAQPETLHKAPIAVVDEDRSPLSRRIADAFYPPYFLPPSFISHARMDARMDAGLDTFALDIPPDFERDVLAGRAPAIQLNVDATRMSQAFTGSGYVQAIVAGEVASYLRSRRAEPAPLELALRVRFNPSLEKSWFGAVMELINHITMLAIVLTGAALIREREHGTIDHLLAMPITPFEIMAAKVWSMGLVVLAAATLSLLLVVRGLIGVPLGGSLALFLAGASLEIFASTSLGIFLGTVARSMPQFAMLAMLLLMPLNILSGAVTPRESMPALVRDLMLASPTTHFVAMAQAVLYRGAGVSAVWGHLLASAAIGAALFSLALARFRRSLAEMG